jgi:hypothetical protein
MLTRSSLATITFLLANSTFVMAGPWGSDWDLDSGSIGIPLWISIPIFFVVAYFALRNSKRN